MSLIISHFSGQTHSNLDFCGDTCGLAWKASLCLLCLFFLAPFPEGPKLALKSDGRVCEGECEGRRGTVMGIKCPENSPTFAWVGGSTRAPFASPFPPPSDSFCDRIVVQNFSVIVTSIVRNMLLPQFWALAKRYWLRN